MSMENSLDFTGLCWEPPDLLDRRVGSFVPGVDNIASFVPAFLPVSVDRKKVDPALVRAACALSDLARCCRAKNGNVAAIRRAANRVAVADLARDGTGTKSTQQAWRDRHQEERAADQAVVQAMALTRLDRNDVAMLHGLLCASTPAALTAWVQPGRIRSMPAFMVTDQEEIAMVFAPTTALDPLLHNLTDFMHQESCTPEDAILKAAMVHQQITMIHAFADGNGRLARLLCEIVILKFFSDIKIFPLEKIFNENRKYYCNFQLSVITHGYWEDWICFFCEFVEKLSSLIETQMELS